MPNMLVNANCHFEVVGMVGDGWGGDGEDNLSGDWVGVSGRAWMGRIVWFEAIANLCRRDPANGQMMHVFCRDEVDIENDVGENKAALIAVIVICVVLFIVFIGVLVTRHFLEFYVFLFIGYLDDLCNLYPATSTSFTVYVPPLTAPTLSRFPEPTPNSISTPSCVLSHSLELYSSCRHIQHLAEIYAFKLQISLSLF